ncbi:unnamed protein product [Schistocephalus solidus]|uniref:Peptidase S1 domain-containing protein n=1 Tax=Schistocephalus solidus TaxID=70667 RepID=A0A183TB78_SCHSO|nr:unnamed protein product [Schistocephalus solidus]
MLGLTFSAAGRGSQIEKYVVVKLKQTTIPPVSIPRAISSGLLRQSEEQPAGMEDALVEPELAHYDGLIVGWGRELGRRLSAFSSL